MISKHISHGVFAKNSTTSTADHPCCAVTSNSPQRRIFYQICMVFFPLPQPIDSYWLLLRIAIQSHPKWNVTSGLFYLHWCGDERIDVPFLIKNYSSNEPFLPLVPILSVYGEDKGVLVSQIRLGDWARRQWGDKDGGWQRGEWRVFGGTGVFGCLWGLPVSH